MKTVKKYCCNLNHIAHVMNIVKGEGKNSESLSKPSKQYADINHEKLVKNESVKYNDSKVPSMNTVIG